MAQDLLSFSLSLKFRSVLFFFYGFDNLRMALNKTVPSIQNGEEKDRETPAVQEKVRE